MSTLQFFGSSTFGVFNSFSISPTIATRTLIAESPRPVEHKGAFRRDVSREPFSGYADAWLANRRAYVKPNTYRSYKQYVEMLCKFFEDAPIGSFDISRVRSYQRWRQDTAGALRINSEVSALQQILREADQWRFIEDIYRPLPVPKTKVRQNMSEEEERRLVAVALDSGKPRRLLAGHCLILMANTSMGFGELRHLRREDVLLDRDTPEVTVNGGTKNDYRIRTIPLNFLALRSMRWILKRWESLGGTEPEQYILPHHARRTPDQQAGRGHQRHSPPIFTEPMGHIYRAARGILKEAGLSHLDPYDMRSHFITKISEDPDVSDETYEQLTGHKGTAMRKRYAKPRMIKKAAAVGKLCIEQPGAAPKLICFSGGKAK